MKRPHPALLRCSLLPAMLLALQPAPVTAQSTVLHGRVVALDNSSVRGLRLRVTGFGDAVVSASGEFSVAIPSSVTEVTIVARDSMWTIVYPLEGRVPVPRGEARVTIVVGEPLSTVLTRALAERHRQSQQLLHQLGVQSDRLEQQLQEVIARLRLDSAKVVDEASRRERQHSAWTPLSEAINRYVLKAKDLHTTIQLLGPVLEDRTEIVLMALAALDSAILGYNAAYERLRTGRDAFESDVERHWPDGQIARRDLADFFDNVFESMHRQFILPLNTAQIAIRQGIASGNRNERFRAARAELAQRNEHLGAELPRLESRATRLLEQLRPR